MTLPIKIGLGIIKQLQHATNQLKEMDGSFNKYVAPYVQDPTLAYTVGMFFGNAVTLFRLSEGREMNTEEINETHQIIKDNIQRIKKILEVRNMQ